MGDTEQVEECILERKVTRFAAAQVASCKDECLRRSVRDPSISMMDRNDLSILLERIRTNHASSVVLKIKDHLIADISSSVFDAIVETLWKNKVCQVRKLFQANFIFLFSYSIFLQIVHRDYTFRILQKLSAMFSCTLLSNY